MKTTLPRNPTLYLAGQEDWNFISLIFLGAEVFALSGQGGGDALSSCGSRFDAEVHNFPCCSSLSVATIYRDIYTVGHDMVRFLLVVFSLLPVSHTLGLLTSLAI